MQSFASFQIQPLDRFAGKSPAVKRPREIACFSYDNEHRFHLDDSSLNYYYPPRLRVSLSEGFEKFQKRDDAADEHLDSLLKTIAALEEKEGKRCEADVITWRGMMTKIMAAPFDKFNNFEMNATYFQGTIYIEEDHKAKLEDQARQRSRPVRRGANPPDLMTYWGYKFETLSLIPDIWDNVSREYIENREHQVVNNSAQYCSVVRTGIGNSSLILGGEVDAVWDCKPDDPEQPINWVELKTSEEIRSDFDMLKFEQKLLKFWIQSFLLGVPKIIVGFRSKNGILERLEELDTQQIPGKVKRLGKNSWDGNLCINFAAGFLDFLKQTITKEGVWKIQRRQGSPVIDVFQVEDKGHGEILPPDFVKQREYQLAMEAARLLG